MTITPLSSAENRPIQVRECKNYAGEIRVTTRIFLVWVLRQTEINKNEDADELAMYGSSGNSDKQYVLENLLGVVYNATGRELPTCRILRRNKPRYMIVKQLLV